MTIGKLLRSGANLAILCALSCLTAFSQTTNATLNGVIADANGAALTQARITAQNTETGLTQITASNTSGVYSISPLPPGKYRISAEQTGFKKSVETITLTVDQEATVNFRLQVGSPVETVNVNAAEVQLNTTNAEISTVVDQVTIADLPLNGRDPSTLIFLSPGVTNILNTPAGLTQSNESMTNEQSASAGGGQQGSTTALLDGIPNMDTFFANMAPFPNADATQEFRAITNSYGAQYGFSPGAIISVDTKSGTNAFHGGAFEFVRNGDLNAGNYFTGAVDTLKRNQFGGFAGGPIIKDKLFFFANYQATRMVYGAQTITAFTPTAQMLKGDFSAVPQVLGAPFATVNGVPNQVDPSLFSKGALGIVNNLVPLGQDPATGQINTSAPGVLSTYNELTARLDYTLSNTQRLFARNFVQEYSHPAIIAPGNMVAECCGGPGEIGKVYNEAVSHTWLPSSKFVNELSAAWISNIVNTRSQVIDKNNKPFCLSEYINVIDPGDCYMDGLYVGNDWEKPDAGSIRIHGQEMVGLALDQMGAIRKRMGFLFQHAALYDSLTVEQNVSFPLQHHKKEMPKSERRDRVRGLLAEVGMEDALAKMPSDISGGMQKRVGLARALVLEPDILLLDEPTAGLDPISSGEIDDLVLKLGEEHHMASVVVTHDLHSAKTIADRLALLNEGNVVIEGSFEELQKSDIEFVREFLGHS